MLEYPVDKS